MAPDRLWGGLVHLNITRSPGLVLKLHDQFWVDFATPSSGDCERPSVEEI